ncbi:MULTISPECIES: methyl-accepting chemotaxis protein [unclassified Achromobacter]|uniref:methyl-accepting chemotaxis protein n=1 Tax=unclassified Achromobacter TaxID=2626865 RepID=UPI000B51AABA|nr:MULTISPECIES: methyl-accepting chemotaxis protein [unclassified Achromobacter]OWT70318.1 methyl-accepting chemotaxis protein [Achromobacter sp. HZ34]OWT71858.1 methyl-accepting chemotaxis protein [Achromobacter sp. HZ28]
MKNLTLRQRLLASFAAILVIMLLMALVDYSRLLAIESEAQGIRGDSLPGLQYSARILNDWQKGHDQLRQGIVRQTPLPALRDALDKADAQLDAQLRGYAQTVFILDDRQVYDTFMKTVSAYRQARAEVVASQQAGDNARARTLLQDGITDVYLDGRAQLANMVDENSARADQSVQHIVETLRHAEWILLAGLILAVLAAIACAALLTRAINTPMRKIVDSLGRFGNGDLSARLQLARRDEFGAIESGFNRMADELTDLVGKAQRSAIQVATSVTEIAATSRQQQATASEVASTTTEIGATSREIAATARDLVRTMSEVSAAADQTATLADGGHHDLSRMEHTMRSVVEAAGTVNGKLGVLNEKAGNINQVVTTINKVADQTNLLSLNAAIEAEKAGEYGRGFVVVATEIRRLADQTAVATYDIEQIVREIQSSVAAGVMGMDKFSEEVRRGMQDMQQVGEQLSQIIQHVQTLAPRVQVVNEGMQAQATGAEQINQALTQLADATQQTVESLRQSSLAIDDLNTVAGDLRGGVTRFKL